jgi:hypothetical protein
MENQFHFKNFEPDLQLKSQVNLVLNRILESAPLGAYGVGLLEREGNGNYLSELEIISEQGSFIANAKNTSPMEALEGLENRLNRQIDYWRSWQQKSGLRRNLAAVEHQSITA